MISMAEILWEMVKDMLSMDDISPEIQQQLLEVKQSIANEYVGKMIKDNPSLVIMKDQVEKFLVNDGWVKDFFLDIFREHALSFIAPEQVDKICYVKEKLSWLKEVPTSEALAALKSDILDSHSISTVWSSSQPSSESESQSEVQDDSQSDSWNEAQSGAQDTTDATSSSQEQQWWSSSSNKTYSAESAWETSEQSQSEHIDGIAEAQWNFIEEVYKSAASQIGVWYKWGWTSPETWFDCSWLWNWAFKQQWIKFKQRLTAESFSFSDVDVSKDQVKVWDFMYWDQKPWKKRHNSIYHIEMVISKPYLKNWKMYVRTLGSSTDAKDDCRNYVGKGVRVREREMKDYRHYWRPPYYYQLAEYQRTGNSSNLVATASKPSSEIVDNVA